jgi:hypothetical protein
MKEAWLWVLKMEDEARFTHSSMLEGFDDEVTDGRGIHQNKKKVRSVILQLGIGKDNYIANL